MSKKPREEVPYDFLSPGSKIKRTVGLEAAFDQELQKHLLEEIAISQLRGDAVIPTFTDVITVLLRSGLVVRREWCRGERQLRQKHQPDAIGSR